MHGPRDANTDSNEEHEKKRALLTHAGNKKLQMLPLPITKIAIAIFIATAILLRSTLRCQR